jgi:hypothetical protein
MRHELVVSQNCDSELVVSVTMRERQRILLAVATTPGRVTTSRGSTSATSRTAIWTRAVDVVTLRAWSGSAFTCATSRRSTTSTT